MESARNKVIVITGATSGIGRAVSLELCRSGAKLVLLGRNAKKGHRLADRILRCSGHGTQVDFYQADLSSLSEVQTLAQQLNERFPVIDVLINNAGARFDTFHQTPEGIERTFATNHLGHFLLTALILDRLLRAPSGRVITVGSGAHLGIHGTPEWLRTESTYDRKLAYGTSKLANVMFAYELARRLSGTTVTSNAVDPGSVATNLARNNGVVPWLRHLVHCILSGRLTPRYAAQGVVYLAFSEEVSGVTGLYFSECKQASSSKLSHDAFLAGQLWSLSVRLTKLDESLGHVWKWLRPADGTAVGGLL
jgi:NAD(P)-dependent dehydrogenase (short-subunit alcohol dehydrogenase family)